MMRGVMYEGVGKMAILDDLPKPSIKPDEVLIKVKYCGICGSDIESYKRVGMYAPKTIIGHEFSGEIIELGNDVKKLKIGDRVTVNPNLPCHDCYWCQYNKENLCKDAPKALGTLASGAMVEFINVRAERIHLLPDSISLQEGALIEPLAVGIYSVEESGIKMAENAAVFGAGTIGLMTIQALKVAGANIFVLEPLESKHKLAEELGADFTFIPKDRKKIQRLTDRIGPAYVFDCVGIGETLTSSINLVRKGGNIILVGMDPEAPLKNFYALGIFNITLRGIFGYVQDTFRTAINLLEKKKVNVSKMITKIVKLNEVPDMFEILSKPHDEIKVVVEFD
jgi:threonine dehydrogenase-like Zn-dependent dehydrogenase